MNIESINYDYNFNYTNDQNDGNCWPPTAAYMYPYPYGRELWLGYSVRPLPDAAAEAVEISNNDESWSWRPNLSLPLVTDPNGHQYTGVIISKGKHFGKWVQDPRGLPKTNQVTNYAIVSDLDCGNSMTNRLTKLL